jgi:hypothetical protein
MLFPFFLPPLLRRQPNAGGEPRLEAAAQRRLEGVGSSVRLCQNSPLPGALTRIVGHVTGEAQRVRGVDRGLYSIADLRAPACPELHGPPGGVGQRALRLPGVASLPLEGRRAALALLQGLPWGVQVRSPCPTRGPLVLLGITALQCGERGLQARLALREQPLQLALGHVARLCMHRLACAPIHSDQRPRTHVQLLAQERQGTAALPQGLAMVTPAMRQGLGGGAERLQQPQQCDLPRGFLLQAAAGAQAVEGAVHIQLPEVAGRIRRASCGSRLETLQAALCPSEFVDTSIHETDGVLFCNRVVEALRTAALLVTVHALDMSHNRTTLQERGIDIQCAK